jgi:putative transcriptional regulator
MNEKDFALLKESIAQAGEIKGGRRRASKRTVIRVPNIPKVRARLGTSQAEFASMIGVSVRTLQNWEQKRREPEGPAKALLRVAEKNPGALIEALRH